MVSYPHITKRAQMGENNFVTNVVTNLAVHLSLVRNSTYFRTLSEERESNRMEPTIIHIEWDKEENDGEPFTNAQSVLCAITGMDTQALTDFIASDKVLTLTEKDFSQAFRDAYKEFRNMDIEGFKATTHITVNPRSRINVIITYKKL